MHGGAKGSGAPRGNCNAVKHGGFTKESLAAASDIARPNSASTKIAERSRG